MIAARRVLPLGGALLLVLVLVFAMPSLASAEAGDEVGADAAASRSAILFLVDRVSFEDLLSVPQVRRLAASGGAALLSSRTSLREQLDRADLGNLAVEVVDLGSVEGPEGGASLPGLQRVGAGIDAALARAPVGDLLVIVATPTPSSAMLAANDDLTGVVMAEGTAVSLRAGLGAPPDRESLTTLTSDSTRRDGVVASIDILPTIDSYLGLSGSGASIRFDRAPVPLELHERYLAYRHLSVPVQASAGIYVAVVALLALAAMRWPGRVPAWLRRITGWAAFSVMPLGSALLLAGHVSPIAASTVVPIVIGSTLLATLAVAWFRARYASVPAAALAGVVVLVLLVIESMLGWRAALTPFLGGGELDGGRFFGMPNVEIGLLLGAALYVAAWLEEPIRGAAVIAGAAFFAGSPWTGSNLGGAVTLFAAAGLWVGVRRLGRFGVGAVGYASISIGAGTLAVLAAHRWLTSSPTHITRFLQGESGGVTGRVVDRLSVGFDLIARDPFALLPVVGVPLSLWILARPPSAMRGVLASMPIWREAILTILLASVVAYLANDSGASALGLGFGTGLGGLLYVSLLDRPEMMEP